MENKIKLISRNVRSGKLPEENIPQLFNYLADQYYDYAGVKLAMHYYAFYESYCDDEDNWSAEAKEILSEINKVIYENILQKQNLTNMEEVVSSVDKIRKDIMNRMNILTAYTDLFQIYEYIINRTEYRFREEIVSEDAEEFAKEILRYIFESQDNVVINNKIKEIIGQLPVRITKQKYLDLLKDSIFIYFGADQSSLETYLYMIRTSAMLYREEGMDRLYPKLREQKDTLAHLKYNEINAEEYADAERLLKQATIFLETEASVYYSLQEIVNEVYTLLLCSTYAGMSAAKADQREEAIISILQGINHAFLQESKEEPDSSLIEKFNSIEGVQEELSYDIDLLEEALYEVDKNYRTLAESMMVDQLLNVLLRSRNLLSNSLFINLEEEMEERTVDEEILGAEADKLERELVELFAGHDRVVSRAVMSNTLNKMPVFFKNHKEVMDYVLYSLERCTDQSEKTACIEIIRGIMSE